MVEREIEINAPIETVFHVIADLKSYPHFLTWVKSVEVRAAGGDLEADFTVDALKPISYTLKFKQNPPQAIEWDLVRGELMKTNSGAWRLEKISDSKTKAFYSVDATFGWMVPKFLVDQLTELQLPKMLEAFKSRAEEKVRNV